VAFWKLSPIPKNKAAEKAPRMAPSVPPLIAPDTVPETMAPVIACAELLAMPSHPFTIPGMYTLIAIVAISRA
jgi:hypothetical protein